MKISEKHWDYWLPAAHAGNAEAQFQLAICYLHGRGVEQSFPEAVQWLQKAAAQNHAPALDSLGVRYATGQGVLQNDREAVRHFRRAAEEGLAVAQFNLALAYVYGQGVAQSYVEAYVWFSLSALQGDEIAEESRDRVAEALPLPALQQAKLLFHRRYQELRRGTAAPAAGMRKTPSLLVAAH